MCRAFRRLGGAGRTLVLLLPLMAFGGAFAVIAGECAAVPGGPFAPFALLDWYRQYLGARPPFRLAFAPFGPLDAWWGDWRAAHAAYALTGVGGGFPAGRRALLWRAAALALPVALALCAVVGLQWAVYRAARPALAARVAAWPRPLVLALAAFAALFPWAWVLYYLAAVAALPPTGDGPTLAAYILLGPGNPALTKRHDLWVWAVVTAATTAWTTEAALLLALARWACAIGLRRARPPVPGAPE